MRVRRNWLRTGGRSLKAGHFTSAEQWIAAFPFASFIPKVAEVAPVKTAVQVFAALLLYLQGYGIQTLSLPFDAQLHLPVWLSVLVTALWVVGITNAFNLIDGIDGLDSGASAFATCC